MTAFLLQIAGFSVLFALASWPLVGLVSRHMAPLPPARRADLSFLLGLLPATAGGLAALALALPSLLVALGLDEDHCLEHGHGPHLCAFHGELLSPLLLGLGGAALAMLALRGTRLVVARLRTARDLRRLTALSRPLAPGVRLVPTDLPICHTVGALRPRVLVSDRLDPEVLPVALAHEAAHVARRDTLQLLLLDLGALALPSGLGAALRAGFVRAADEVCDDAAAQIHGPLRVAEALLRVARGPALPGALALCAGDLERRVRRLLDGGAPPAPSRALPLGLALGSALLALAALGADPLHHAVEHLLHPHV